MARLIAVDTNVLLRTLVDDEDAPEQCRRAQQLLAEAETVHVDLAVLLETVWILAKSYRVKRADLVRLLAAVAQHPKIQLAQASRVLAAIQIYASTNIDFADAIVLANAREHGVTLHTFDRKLAKQTGATLVS